MAVGDAVQWGEQPAGFDQIAADLRAMRSAAGDPAFAEIGRRIAATRAQRGVPAHEQRVARSTLYDCFRDGRRRMNIDVVNEIAAALGLPEHRRARWAARVRTARMRADGAQVVEATTMPPPVSSFVGRERETAEVVGALVGTGADTASPVWVTAMAGTGKTQLALRAAEQLAARGASGIFVDLRGHRAGSSPVAPSAAQRAILHALGGADEPSDDESARRRTLTRLLRDSGRLLVLDDASGSDQVRRIIGDGAGMTIVTSRSRPGDETGWRTIDLAGMDAGEATALIAARARPDADESPMVSPEDAQRLVDLCGGLPLVLTLVAGRLTAHPDWTLADHIELLQRRVRAGRIDDALRAELDLSYRDLTAAAATLLRRSADLPMPEPDIQTAAALLGVSAEDAERAVTLLVERNLAIRTPARRLRLHSLVRAYARDLAEETDSPASRDEAFGRAAHDLAERVWAAYRVLANDQGDHPRPTAFRYPMLSWTADQASRWLETSLEGLLGVAHEAPDRGCPELMFRLSEGLSWWMNLTGRQVAALELHEAAADCASELRDADALAMASLDAGQLLVHTERTEQALMHFARARRLIDDADGLTDSGLLGVLRNMEASVLTRQGKLDEAIAALEWAVELHDRHGEDARMLSALTNLGIALHTVGRFDEEEAALERGLARAAAVSNELFLAFFRVNRSELLLERGALDEAAADAAAAIDISEQIGVPFLVVSAQGVLAEVFRRRVELDEAESLATRALGAAREMGQDLTAAELLIVAARIAADRDDHLRAEALLGELEQALAGDGDHVLRGRAWQLRAELARDAEHARAWRARAIEAFERAGARHRAEELVAVDAD